MTKPTTLLLRDKILIFFSGSLMSFVVVAFCVLSMNFGYHVIIFSLLALLASVFYLHKHFYTRIINIQKDLELYYQNECKRTQSIERHSLRNQLQVLSGYIETEQFDKALDCIADLSNSVGNIPAHRGFDALQIRIHQYMHKAYTTGFKLSYDLEALALNPASRVGQTPEAICKAASFVLKQIWDNIETQLGSQHELYLSFAYISDDLRATPRVQIDISLANTGIKDKGSNKLTTTTDTIGILNRLSQMTNIEHRVNLNKGIIQFYVEI